MAGTAVLPPAWAGTALEPRTWWGRDLPRQPPLWARTPQEEAGGLIDRSQASQPKAFRLPEVWGLGMPQRAWWSVVQDDQH